MPSPTRKIPALRIASLRESLSQQRDRRIRPGQDAAVALVLAGSGATLRCCLIRRAERTEDPWSAQIALPGGRANATDRSASHTARRETEEEIGLQLGAENLLGFLAPVAIQARGRPQRGRIFTCVFRVGPRPPALRCNAEVAAVFWLPLARLWSPEDSVWVRAPGQQGVRRLPALRLGQARLWGVTYRILTQLAHAWGAPLLKPHAQADEFPP